ncbi:putative monooxygenase [Xylariaceae sp. FL1651]|nr:putative monooxygenase [Xylariaceae sp. FL1651]
MAPSSPPHVLIVGAGLGGLALAQALRKKGIPYEIFERDRSERERRPGWVIGLHHMLDDLKASIPDDLPPISSISNLLPLTDYLPEFAYYNPAAPTKGKIGVRDDGSGWVIRAARHKIIEWLATHIPVQYNKRAVKIEEADKKVKVYFQDGTSAEGDILVGAEGSRSTTRKHILKDKDPIRPTRSGIISGMRTLSGEDMKEQLDLGHSLYVVDLTSTNGSPLVLLVSLGEMNPDGKSGEWFYGLMWPDERATKEDFWTYTASAKEQYDFVMQKIKDLPAKYRTVVEGSEERTLTPPIRLYTLIMDSMPTGRITLLGDAAHAMPPFRGEGAFHAITDALNLARALDKINVDDIGNIKQVFGAYQEEMLQRGAKAAKLSEGNFARKREVGGGDPIHAWGCPLAPLPDEDNSV